MKIETTVTTKRGGKHFPPGTVMEIDEERGKALIKNGKAREVVEKAAVDLTKPEAGGEGNGKGKKGKKAQDEAGE